MKIDRVHGQRLHELDSNALDPTDVLLPRLLQVKMPAVTVTAGPEFFENRRHNGGPIGLGIGT
jgi:hypothetical protein